LGESGERSLDIRLVTATNRDLRAAVTAGTFRADLYYRLEEMPVRIPSLRDRREDIPLLAESFLAEFSNLSPQGPIGLSRQVMRDLESRPWPGNVRELRNAVRRIVISADTSPVESLAGMGLEEGLAPAKRLEREAAEDKPRRLSDLEKESIEKALAETGGDVGKAAAILGIGRATLYRKLKQAVSGKEGGKEE
jgi:DNA-binding NtrC family response regulator